MPLNPYACCCGYETHAMRLIIENFELKREIVEQCARFQKLEVQLNNVLLEQFKQRVYIDKRIQELEAQLMGGK